MFVKNISLNDEKSFLDIFYVFLRNNQLNSSRKLASFNFQMKHRVCGAKPLWVDTLEFEKPDISLSSGHKNSSFSDHSTEKVPKVPF